MQESRQSEPPKGVHATFLHLFRGFWQISAGQNATLGGPWRITHLIHTHTYIYILLFVYIYIMCIYIYRDSSYFNGGRWEQNHKSPKTNPGIQLETSNQAVQQCVISSNSSTPLRSASNTSSRCAARFSSIKYSMGISGS